MPLTRVYCPSCQTSYRITEGKKGSCPRCRVALVPEAVPINRRGYESRGPRTGIQPVAGCLLASLIAAVLIGGAGIGAGLWWMHHEDNQQIEQQIREDNERHQMQMREIDMKAKRERLELERPDPP